MENVLNLYKEAGETPLACLERFRESHPQYAEVKMAYAGRLDPMAEGVLVVLVADEIARRQEYFALAKEYEVDILLGVETDSYDMLGMPRVVRVPTDEDLARARQIIARWPELTHQTYPPYSSKSVEGRQLHQWARAGEISEIELPSHPVVITQSAVVSARHISGNTLLESAREKISRVSGDFRQDEIVRAWELALAQSVSSRFIVIKASVSCGGGTYMRVLAHELGAKLGTGAIAAAIMRTKVGDFTIRDAR